MASSHSNALDGTAVSELIALDPDGSQGLLAELAEVFFADGKLHISTISNAISATSVRNAAHALKGTSSTMGAQTVAQLAGQLETGELAPSAEVVAALSNAHQNAVKELRELAKGLPSKGQPRG